jgi:carbamoyltransferase
MSYILGLSAGFHDAAATLIDYSGNILFAGHSERYSKKKNDAELHVELIKEATALGYEEVAFYEVPWRRQMRAVRSGEKFTGPWTVKGALDLYLGKDRSSTATEHAFGHHLSHAAAGFQTSPFKDAVVVVIDAIGELDTISIYHADYDHHGIAQYKPLWRQRYPHSIGLFYSAVTKRVGLKPLDEEYITMGMAGWGKTSCWLPMYKDVVNNPDDITFKRNFHIGVDNDWFAGYSDEDIAASAQSLAEGLIMSVMRRAFSITRSRNLVYSGGVALNCVANAALGKIFDNIWIMPNPGDAGSSLGAAALAYGYKLNWTGPYLGTNIPGEYPVDALLHELETNKIVGVASGRAEFGPRALGNRSLLADPRGAEIKDQVNEIKRRQKFRPFAPVILEEHVNDYFDMPWGWRSSRYMQTVAHCRHPDLFPAIVHVDGTSRVQTVPKDCSSGIRQLLEAWYERTGCPMLLNTSLNIRGEPMVNDRADADRFEQKYKVKVCS